MRFNDAVLGFVILVFGAAAALYADMTFPSLPGQEFGPAFFPTIIGTVLFGCGVILLVQGIARQRSEPLLVFGEWARLPRHVVNFFLVFLALIAYILFTDSIGFIPVSFLILSVLMVRFGSGWITAIVIGLVATLIIHTLFYKFLLVPLPWGILEPLQW